MTKLTKDQKEAIRARRGESQTTLAAEYGVAQASISRVQREGMPKKATKGPDRRGDQELRELLEQQPRDPETGCWVWSGALSEGYGALGRDGRKGRAHRVSYEVFHGPIPDLDGYHGACVCHHCDNPPCVNPEHLFLGTQGANLADAETKGRMKRPILPGEQHGRALVTEDQVRAIRQLYGERVASQRQLGERFGLSQTTVSAIVLHKRWRHI